MKSFRMGRVFFGCCLIMVLSFKGEAYPFIDRYAKEISNKIIEISNKVSMPAELLSAIAEYESKYWAWAVNVEGKSYWCNSRECALSLIKDKVKYDLGIMQINNWWLKKLDISPEVAIEPMVNIYLGAFVLSDCMKRYNNIDEILSCYHTGGVNDRGVEYANKVKKILYEIMKE